MIEAPVRAVSDVVAEFLACKPSDEQVLAYFMPPYLQDRVHYLLDLNGEDELTALEAEELEELARADDLFGLLKAKIKRKQRLSAL